MDPDAANEQQSIARSTPPEVLSHIFTSFVDDYQRDLLNHHSLRTDQGAWTLAKVCHQWRTIVHDTSHFWNTIRVVYLVSQGVWCPPDTVWRNIKDIISYQLSLSKNSPLTVHISCPSSLPSIVRLHFMDLVRLLLPHQHRWRTFELHNVTDIVCQIAFLNSFKSLNCPHLKRLETYIPPLFAWNPIPLFSKQGCPSLIDVTLQTYPPDLTALPWSQLESLELTEMEDSNDFIPILRESKNLISLSISHSVLQSQRPANGFEACVLPRLRCLSLRSCVTGTFLCSIVTPELDYLSIDVGCQQDISFLTELITRSQCSITWLSYRTNFSFELFVPLLLHVNALKHLSLDMPYENDAFGAALSRKLDEGVFWLCPKLNDIRLMVAIPRTTQGEILSIVDMLQVRASGSDSQTTDGLSNRLRRVEVRLYGEVWVVPDEVKRRLLVLKNGGLDVFVW